MDESEFDSIAINTINPFIARLLGWTGATLATAGVTVNFGDDFSLRLATIVVGLAGMVIHQVMAKASQKSTAQTSFIQGAACAGVVLTKADLPPVVNGIVPPDAPIEARTGPAIQSTAFPTNSIPQPPAPPKPPEPTIAVDIPFKPDFFPQQKPVPTIDPIDK